MALLTYPNARSLNTSIRAKALVFEDAKSRAILAKIERLAPSEANVLIMSETGTGKELVARHIHTLSRRNQGPFLAVNCGAFSETLVESELFGHERGAFTGATDAKAGWFEAADGGTLFLDEIGDLPLNMQVKLLRVLQEREVVRLGSRKAKPVNVRVVAATNIHLENAVTAGKFREDLYYRLRVASIELSPLRERPGDILPLAEFFLRDYTSRLHYAPATFSESSNKALLSHNWPGNIRELENVIHYALLVCQDSVIKPEDLQIGSSELRNQHSPTSSTHKLLSPKTQYDDPIEQLEAALIDLFETNPDALFDKIEEAVMSSAFRYCHRNQVQTAKLLGISRNIVRARLLKIGEIKAESESIA
ncbi:sigma-54 interaction domain-containing protein [Aquirhabdus parva]|uniref:Sigma-54-dependent Fis family transcriptional regulator n=1 Tax=Aquirhabdus parva TaxID=2283318 RepID=A0A345P4K8_9GAMM|nr:sigma-54 dependent transcriptional regulator [Aquirhabdus parva]AXI02217.1 sigma-54-dependent Fis family transcriptional regulator [Aquirhabdus parva]